MMKKVVAVILSVMMCGMFSALKAGDASLRSISRAHTSSLNGLYIAGIDGMNSSFNNTAGLIFNPGLVELSFVDLIGQPSLTHPVNGLYKAFQEDNFAFAAGIIYPLSGNLVVSLSYQRAYDYNVNWPFAVLTSADTISVLQSFDMNNHLNVDAILPAIAYRFGDFSIGAAFDIFYVNYSSAFPVTNTNWVDSLNLPAYQMEYNMDTWSFGFNAGVMYEISEELRIGAFARSSFTADLEGEAISELFEKVDSISARSPVTTGYEYPWVFGAGLLYRLSPEWAFNLDFQYTLFENSRQSLQMDYAEPGWEAKNLQLDPMTGMDPDDILLAFRNAADAGIGIEYILTNWSFRGGYRFTQTQNNPSSYNYMFPTTDQHCIALGLGHNDSVYFIDLSASYAFGNDTEIVSAPAVSGTYDSETINATFTLKYAF
jgi:long-subunit fatty acid transport protein